MNDSEPGAVAGLVVVVFEVVVGVVLGSLVFLVFVVFRIVVGVVLVVLEMVVFRVVVGIILGVVDVVVITVVVGIGVVDDVVRVVVGSPNTCNLRKLVMQLLFSVSKKYSG